MVLYECDQIISCRATRASSCFMLVFNYEAFHVKSLDRKVYIIIYLGSNEIIISESLQVETKYIR